MLPLAGAGLATLTLLLGCVLAYLQPLTITIPVGRSLAWPFIAGFHATERNPQNVGFRWTTAESAIGAPFAGNVTGVALRLNGEATTPPLTIAVAGSRPLTIVPRTGWQTIALPVRDGGRDWQRGNPLLAIDAVASRRGTDPRLLGVAVAEATLTISPSAPPPTLVGLLLASMLLLGGLLRSLRLPAPWALCTALALLAALALANSATRLYLTVFAWRLLGLLLLSWCLYGLGLLLLPRLWRAMDLTVSRRTTNALAGIVVLAFGLRFGGMSYPLNFISDIRFILARARMVREGRLLELFLPNPSLTPVQWNMDVTVPRSPLFYILTAPLTYLAEPWPALSMMALSSAVDALAVLLVAVLVLQAGGGQRSALLAALLAAVLPLGLVLAVSWGVYTTLLAQCLMLLAFATWLHLRPRLHERRSQLLLAGVFTLAYLSYPTAVLFLGLTWALLLGWCWRRDPAAGPTLRAGLLAAAAALLLYYGWHVPEIVGRTLPKMGERLAGGNDSLSLNDLVGPIWPPLRQWYGWLLVALAGLGAGLLLATPKRGGRVAATGLFAAWGLTYPLLALIDEHVATLILKQILYVLPLVALLAGLLLGRLATRRWGWVVALALVALVGWKGLLITLDLIVNANQGLK